MRLPGFPALLTAGAVLGALLVSPVASASAAPGPSAQPRAADAATATGYHFQTLRPADVIAGSTDNNLVVTYTAGRALRDGTVRVALPGGKWRTPLHAITGLLGETSTYDRAVVVRPAPDPAPGNEPLPEPTIDPATACGWPDATPLSWSVQSVLGSQVVVIRHVTCAPGQRLFVRVKAVAAPARVGRHLLPIVASDRDGPRLSVATVDVVPTPSVTLQVTTPSVVAMGVPFLLEIRAARPDGSTAVDYTGAVAVVSEDKNDCTLTPRGQQVAYQFTRADRGLTVLQVQLDTAQAHRIRVYDVANKANPGVTGRFDVGGSPPPGGVICPASYH